MHQPNFATTYDLSSTFFTPGFRKKKCAPAQELPHTSAPSKFWELAHGSALIQPLDPKYAREKLYGRRGKPPRRGNRERGRSQDVVDYYEDYKAGRRSHSVPAVNVSVGGGDDELNRSVSKWGTGAIGNFLDKSFNNLTVDTSIGSIIGISGGGAISPSYTLRRPASSLQNTPADPRATATSPQPPYATGNNGV
jgi:hypothetical protein